MSEGRSDIRVDLQYIADMIEPRTRVLDIGCGDGALLSYLSEFKQVDARGIELSMAGVKECVSDGLSVIQGDADTDLEDYPDGAFDYAVLSQTLQATRRPRQVVENLVRIGTGRRRLSQHVEKTKTGLAFGKLFGRTIRSLFLGAFIVLWVGHRREPSVSPDRVEGIVSILSCNGTVCCCKHSG